MKLNMDLIRKILLFCEDKLPDNEKSYSASELSFPGCTKEEIVFHVSLLIDGGYIKYIDASSMREHDYFIESLTLSGYEFLEAIKSDTVWNSMKEVAGGVGIQAVKFAIPILTDIVKKQLLGLT